MNSAQWSVNLSDMKNLLREKMLRGEKCVGPFIWMGGPSVAEAMTFTNADFMVLDTEHGVFDIESVQSMIRAAQKGNVTCCARIKDCSRPSVLKMLDVGAQALIIPDVRSIEEVRQMSDTASISRSESAVWPLRDSAVTGMRIGWTRGICRDSLICATGRL